jgi:hypothetical protein
MCTHDLKNYGQESQTLLFNICCHSYIAMPPFAIVRVVVVVVAAAAAVLQWVHNT